MQKVLIIGNGFDLHHHLPTKYDHFIDVLKAIEGIEDRPSYSFQSIFCDINKDFKNQISKSYDTANIAYPKEVILDLKEKMKSNTWYQCFKQIKEINTWIDFETQIGNILNVFSIFFEKSNSFLSENHNSPFVGVNNSPMHPKGGFSINSNQFKILIDFDIIELVNPDFYGNVKIESIIKTNHLLTQNNSIYAINENQILNDLSNSLEQFIKIFNIYFSDIIEPFYANYKKLELIKDSEEQDISILTSKQVAISGLQNSFSKIYSFNYTPTLSRFYNTSEIDFLHGHSGINQNIVLGIDGSENGFKQRNLFAFTKYYQKLYKNTDYRFIDEVLKSNIDTHFFIWGHSLDQSDGEYIKEVVSLLVKARDANKFKLTVFYFNNSTRASQIQNLLQICGKESIEISMKNECLIFEKSDNQNLLNMVQTSYNTYSGYDIFAM